MGKTNRLTSIVQTVGAVCFWTSWLLMPGIGVTDAARILTLVSAQPHRVLASSVVQLLSAALFSLAVPGLARRFQAEKNVWMRPGTALLGWARVATQPTRSITNWRTRWCVLESNKPPCCQ